MFPPHVAYIRQPVIFLYPVGERGGRGIQLLRSHLELVGGPFKCEYMQTGGSRHVNVNVCMYIFLIAHLLDKSLRIITRFFVSFIKILVLLKISVLKQLYFTANFQTVTNITKNSILHVKRVLDTPRLTVLSFCQLNL